MSPETEDAIRCILEQGWVKDIHWFDTIDSTSDEAKRQVMASDIAETTNTKWPTLFVADSQTKGRGRGNHRWWSPNGCLMMTLVLGADSMPPSSENWSQLALVVGLAVAETVEGFVDDTLVQLKWPNDVFLEGKKCAGILIESGPLTGGQLPPSWLIGIGLNVNMHWRDAPEEVVQRATCIRSHARRDVTITQTLPALIESIESAVTEWSSGSQDWLAKWQARCLLGSREVEIALPSGQRVLGTCRSIDSTGRLIIDSNAERMALLSGEVVSWSE